MPNTANHSVQIFAFLLSAACSVCAAQSTSAVNTDVSGASVNSSSAGVDQTVSSAPSILGSANGNSTASTPFNAGSAAFNLSYSGPKQTTSGGNAFGSSVGDPRRTAVASASIAGWRGGAESLSAASTASAPMNVQVMMAGGVSGYSNSFPDSTKGTASLSPPMDMDLSPFGSFAPSVGSGFPDMSQRQFLNPQLHVSAHFGGRRAKQDLYSRLEARLKQKTSAAGLSKPPDQPFAHEKSGLSSEQNRLKNPSIFDDQNF